jgi:hypothetical protein
MLGHFEESRLLNPDFRDMLSALLQEHAEFLVVGSYALAAHGHPRTTGDIDIWIRPTQENSSRVWSALERFGAPLDRTNPDDLRVPGNVLQIGIVPRRIDLMTSIEAVTFEEAWSRRVEVELEGLRIPVLGRVDLLANKKALDRPQDRADVARLEGSS